jgi:hypothetical protein
MLDGREAVAHRTVFVGQAVPAGIVGRSPSYEYLGGRVPKGASRVVFHIMQGRKVIQKLP